MGAKPVLKTKLEAADAALLALGTRRDDEIPTDFHGGKFSDAEAGWYWSLQFRRTLANTVDAVNRPEYVDGQIQRTRREILAWVASAEDHTPD